MSASLSAASRLLHRNSPELWLSGDEESERFNFFKTQVAQMRRDFGYGRDKIRKLLKDEYGQDETDKRGFPYSNKTVEKMYKGVPKGPVSSAAAFSNRTYSNIDMPYLKRLDLLKRYFLKRPGLTVSEADTAIQLQHYFESPSGDPVDLFPQLAVIDAYASASEANLSVDDLESMLILQPWKPAGAVIYWRAVRQRQLQIPRMPLISEIVDTAGPVMQVTPYILGANAQLGLPAVVYFIRDEVRFSTWSFLPDADPPYPPEELDAAHAHVLRAYAELCNWRNLVFPTTFPLNQQTAVISDTKEANNGDR